MGEQIIPGWKIIRVIGKGSFGSVYEIEKEDEFGESIRSALKVISIPESSAEIEAYRDDGYDDASLTALYRSRVEDITSEFRLMNKLKGCSNIVSYEDHLIVRHDDDIGYDVLIRMELLTPLPKYFDQHFSGTEADGDIVMKLGVDICRALERCGRHNIIHRDIKPQNIFVNEEGDFKLGDFGIAKTSDHTTKATKTGTYGYMAPEVYRSLPYNASVDIYSLGMVLYWMLNERRGPFLPLPPETPKTAQASLAMERRMNGEPLPAPKHGSEALKRIVLKACAFDPKVRYRNPEEMRKDLEILMKIAGNGTVSASFGAVPTSTQTQNPETVRSWSNNERTVSLTPDPATGRQNQEATIGLFPKEQIQKKPVQTAERPMQTVKPAPNPVQPEKYGSEQKQKDKAKPKKKGFLIVLSVTLLLLTAVVVLIVLLLKGCDSCKQRPKASAVTPEQKTVTAEPTDTSTPEPTKALTLEPTEESTPEPTELALEPINEATQTPTSMKTPTSRPKTPTSTPTPTPTPIVPTATMATSALEITVTFNANDGSVSTSSKNVLFGQSYGSLPTPTRSGYNFDGWYTANSGGNKVTSSTTVTNSSNHTLYAHWVAVHYTVYFNANGGDVSTSSKTVLYGSTYGELPTPAREGYAFDGWYTAASDGSKVTSSTTVTNTSNHTLYAHWTEEMYHLDLNGLLDGASSSNISGYGTADVYINGSLVANDCKDFYMEYPYGTSYEIRDIKAASDKEYVGVYTGSLSGRITGFTRVVLQFRTLTWTDWSTETPPSGAINVQTKTQYRYRNKEYKNSTNSSESGWILYDGPIKEYSSWSAWSTTAVSSSSTVEVESQMRYRYYYFKCSNCGYHMPYWGNGHPCWSCGQKAVPEGSWTELWISTKYNDMNYSSTTTTYKKKVTINGELYYFDSSYLSSIPDSVKKMYYRFRTITYRYYYYRWTSWSSWSDTYETGHTEYENRTLYRYQY